MKLARELLASCELDNVPPASRWPEFSTTEDTENTEPETDLGICAASAWITVWCSELARRVNSEAA
jgi:hypothetical protein